MELHSLKPAKGAVKSVKRIARGQGSGHGGTATRGHKGDKARSGHKNKRNFEGGQMPLQMRLPKRGFKNVNRVEYVALNLSRIQEIAEKHNVSELSLEALITMGVVKRTDRVKVLAGGELKTKVSIGAHAASEAAKAAIESLGGSVNLV